MKNYLELEKSSTKLINKRNQSKQWLNELAFIHDEQSFIEHLLGSHFLELSTSKLFESTKDLIKELKNIETKGRELSVIIRIHKKRIATSIDNEIEDNEALLSEHNRTEIEFNNYVSEFKVVKMKIFDMIKEIMKKNKLKFLLKKR